MDLSFRILFIYCGYYYVVFRCNWGGAVNFSRDMLPVNLVQKHQFVLFKMPTKEEKKEDIFYWYVYDDVCSVLIGYDVFEDASES